MDNPNINYERSFRASLDLMGQGVKALFHGPETKISEVKLELDKEIKRMPMYQLYVIAEPNARPKITDFDLESVTDGGGLERELNLLAGSEHKPEVIRVIRPKLEKDFYAIFVDAEYRLT